MSADRFRFARKRHLAHTDASPNRILGRARRLPRWLRIVATLRLRDTRRAMSRKNVEILRHIWATWTSEDMLTASLDSFHPEVKWHTREDAPDAGVYHGHEGVEKLMGFWRDTFVELRLEAEEFIDGGDDDVIVPMRVYGRGKTSDVAVELHYTFVCKVRDGRIVEVREFTSKAEALEAVGIAG
jgi:ketosteroid isomerase-like protein